MKYIDHIYIPYILEKEKQNFKESINRAGLNQKFKFEFFKGCDGKKLVETGQILWHQTISEISWENFKRAANPYLEKMNKLKRVLEKIRKFTCIENPAQYGNQTTFINIISDAIQNNYNRILIFEPDALFCKNFLTELDYYYNYIKDSCLFYLGASQQFWPLFKRNPVEKIYHPFCTNGLFAIAIHNDLFKEYLFFLKLRYLTSDGSLWILQEKYNKKSFVAYPNLVIANLDNSLIMDKEPTYDLYKWNRTRYL